MVLIRSAALVAVVALALVGCTGGGSERGAATSATGTAEAAIDLSPIPLVAEDVGGAEVQTDAPIEAPPGANASYHRLLEPGTTVGRSTFQLLESTVTEFDDAAEATGFVTLVGGSLTPDFFEQVIQRSAGLQVEKLTGARVDVELGDQSVVQLARFDAAGGGSHEAMFAFVRIGRLVQAMFAVTPAGELDVADVAGLVGAVAARMRDAQSTAA